MFKQSKLVTGGLKAAAAVEAAKTPSLMLSTAHTNYKYLLFLEINKKSLINT